MKVALVGSAPSSNRLAPFHDPSWQIWACSPDNMNVLPRVDLWCELHGDLGWPEYQSWAVPYIEWLNAQTFDVLAIDNTFVRRAQPFPKEEMLAKYGPFFFTSSFSWMIALAIERGATEIAIFGIDMATDEEYCVAPSTRVLTEDLRWVPASSVDVGDNLIAFDEMPRADKAYRQWRVAKVESAQRLVRPCYRLHMEDGKELVASAEHRWLTFSEHENKWRKTEDMATSAHRNGRPTKIVKLVDTWDEIKTWEAGYLAAAFDGEGFLSQKNANGDGSLTLGFSQRENAMSAAVVDAGRSLGFEVAFSARSANAPDCLQYRLSGGRSVIMEFLGSIRPKRLITKFDPSLLGTMHRKDAVAVTKAEYIGEQEVIGLGTTTGTFVADGYASHNSKQRPGFQHFLWLAMQRGIKIMAPDESDILQPPPLYGYDRSTAFVRKLYVRKNEISGRIEAMRRQRDELNGHITHLSGALDDLDYMLTIWSGHRARSDADQQVERLLVATPGEPEVSA